MRQFIISLNISVCFGHANMEKKWIIYYVGDNIEYIVLDC